MMIGVLCFVSVSVFVCASVFCVSASVFLSEKAPFHLKLLAHIEAM